MNLIKTPGFAPDFLIRRVNTCIDKGIDVCDPDYMELAFRHKNYFFVQLLLDKGALLTDRAVSYMDSSKDIRELLPYCKYLGNYPPLRIRDLLGEEETPLKKAVKDLYKGFLGETKKKEKDCDWHPITLPSHYVGTESSRFFVHKLITASYCVNQGFAIVWADPLDSCQDWDWKTNYEQRGWKITKFTKEDFSFYKLEKCILG